MWGRWRQPPPLSVGVGGMAVAGCKASAIKVYVGRTYPDRLAWPLHPCNVWAAPLRTRERSARSHSRPAQGQSRPHRIHPNAGATAMDLANIIALVSSAHVDPTTAPEVNVDPEVTETVIGRNLPKPERGSKKQASNQAAPIHSKASAPGVALNTGDKLDAKSFILAMRNAGKRWVEGKGQVFDKNHERNDQIQAIASYTGYDNARDFGSQQQAAMAQAQRELRGGVTPGPTREEKRAAERSMSGYVAGMPLPAQKLLANLRAREQAAAEAMIDAKTPEEKAAHKQLLDTIRKAIDELV